MIRQRRKFDMTKMNGNLGLMLAIVALLFAAAPEVYAQPFNLQGGAINGGNQVAHGGPFSVAASSGQTASGQSSGGPFGMQGGESTGASPLTSPIVPTMVVMHSTPANVIVAWQPLVSGYVLEFADTLKSPVWATFAGDSTNLLSVSSRSRHLFFRLRNTITQTE